VEQRIIDPQGDEDWAIHGRVDLRAGETPADESPVVELVRIGR